MTRDEQARVLGFLSSVRFVLIGSAAVQRLRPEVLDGEPKDLDLLVHPADLVACGAGLEAAGGRLESWGEPIAAAALDAGDGRFYVRACFADGGIVDATYGSPLPFDEAWRDRVVVDVACASVAHIAQLMRARGLPRDLRRAALLVG